MKLKTLDQLKIIIDLHKSHRKKIVWTNGCFDLLHPGHIFSLEKAKEKGDILIVGLDSDSSVRKLKGFNRPIIQEEYRIKFLEALSFVDYIIIINFNEAKYIIKELMPDIYVKSGNYNLDTINQEERIVVEDYGGEIYIPKGLEGFSTTDIIKKIKNE
ncbi:MAG: adenylyltransferase/cytidyltransferase family protein [Nanoarchaeota archaeon]